jgi:hypothetical protein
MPEILITGAVGWRQRIDISILLRLPSYSTPRIWKSVFAASDGQSGGKSRVPSKSIDHIAPR